MNHRERIHQVRFPCQVISSLERWLSAVFLLVNRDVLKMLPMLQIFLEFKGILHLLQLLPTGVVTYHLLCQTAKLLPPKGL
jgi:hypothetical protein